MFYHQISDRVMEILESTHTVIPISYSLTLFLSTTERFLCVRGQCSYFVVFIRLVISGSSYALILWPFTNRSAQRRALVHQVLLFLNSYGEDSLREVMLSVPAWPASCSALPRTSVCKRLEGREDPPRPEPKEGWGEKPLLETAEKASGRLAITAPTALLPPRADQIREVLAVLWTCLHHKGT
ncbi:hypothetical protein GOODEAATRI_002399 [Goodea atripinnis]|uniref:Uncharacterized protein n=1 Tax=Goodea atripinnis TaxID=208336 RepID=A0ABV0MNP0_9TELE